MKARKPNRKRVQVTHTVGQPWLDTINSLVPRQSRSRFIELAGFLAIADTAELRNTYRQALDVILGRTGLKVRVRV